MNTNPLKESGLTEHSAGIGTVTRDMVHSRASELAVIDGRLPVSYTHLDVYKRQVQDRLRARQFTDDNDQMRRIFFRNRQNFIRPVFRLSLIHISA